MEISKYSVFTVIHVLAITIHRKSYTIREQNHYFSENLKIFTRPTSNYLYGYARTERRPLNRVGCLSQNETWLQKP